MNMQPMVKELCGLTKDIQKLEGGHGLTKHEDHQYIRSVRPPGAVPSVEPPASKR